MTEALEIRPAELTDLEQALALLPQLADFDVPERRDPKHLWEGDAALFTDVVKVPEDVPMSFAHVAVDNGGRVQGLILVTMRDELMSHAPSAHLEAIVVAPTARGQGLGRRLLTHCEAEVKRRGAESLSLHVFANNKRASTLYAAEGCRLRRLGCRAHIHHHPAVYDPLRENLLFLYLLMWCSRRDSWQ